MTTGNTGKTIDEIKADSDLGTIANDDIVLVSRAGVSGGATFSGIPNATAAVKAWAATPSSANLRAAVTDESGDGALYFQNGALGTPSAGVLSNCTGYPVASINGLASGIAAFLSSPSSANLITAITDETGTGNLVFGTAPTITNANLVTPALGVASATSVNKVAITAPASSATLTLSDGKTLSIANTLTFSGADGSTIVLGAGGTVLYNGGALGTPASGTLTNCTGLTVAGWGTGRASATAYAPIVGGTTSTGAQQSMASGSPGQIMQSAGNAAIPTWSTPTYPNTSGAARKILVSDGTNNVYSTETYAVPGSAGNLMRSDGTNWTAVKATLTTDVTGILPIANGGSGVASSKPVIQRVYTQTGAVATGTTLIPADDTVPQNTEGDQYMSLTITPTNASNILRIDIQVMGSHSVLSTTTTALFQDSTANALAATTVTQAGISYVVNYNFSYIMVAGTTSSTTFKVRCGGANAGTFTFNGQAGARLFGGVANSFITITETAV